MFGAQHAMGGHLVRTIGVVRARVKIGMMNLVYNMRRLAQLLKREVQAAIVENNHDRKGASAVAQKQEMPRKVIIFTEVPV
jgi:hypothetical protein